MIALRLRRQDLSRHVRTCSYMSAHAQCNLRCNPVCRQYIDGSTVQYSSDRFKELIQYRACSPAGLQSGLQYRVFLYCRVACTSTTTGHTRLRRLHFLLHSSRDPARCQLCPVFTLHQTIPYLVIPYHTIPYPSNIQNRSIFCVSNNECHINTIAIPNQT